LCIDKDEIRSLDQGKGDSEWVDPEMCWIDWILRRVRKPHRSHRRGDHDQYLREE
jgi:hypothetical protein